MIYYLGTPRLTDTYKTTTMDFVVDYLQKQSVLGVDTETEGMDFTCKKMIMFQIGDCDKQFVIDTRHISIEPLREILESKKIIKILHNAKFDYKFIKKWANIEINGIYDTFLTERVLHCGKKDIRYGLKHLVKKYFDKDLDKETRNKFVKLDGSPYTDRQIKYGAEDVEYLIKIKNLQEPKIKEHKLNDVVDLENKAVLAFADMEYNGLDLDTEKWRDIGDDFSMAAISIHHELVLARTN